MTNGGGTGTSGGTVLRTWLVWLAVGSVFTVVNAASVIDDHARFGRPVEPWRPWVWEITSLAGWLLLVPLVALAAARLRPPRWRLPAALAAHAALSAVLSALHVGTMVALRKLIYALNGLSYAMPGSTLDILIYEYRKDAATYAAIVLIFLLIERMGRAPATPGPEAEPRLEVRDGARTVWLAPGDVEWAQAAGNYVELHGAFGTLLHRETLAALEERLGEHGFRRIHRSRLVRAAAVRAVETKASGDFEVALASGARVAGSRRFRSRLTD